MTSRSRPARVTAQAALPELHPSAAAALQHVVDCAWRGADAGLLELCDRRVAEMLGNSRYDAPQVDPATLSDRERAHLDFTEQFVISVADVSDADVEALLRHGSPEEVFEFIAALHVLEMAQRMDMTLRAVL